MVNLNINSGRSNLPLESDLVNPHALISWRSIVAGLLLAFFTMTGLIGLGLAFGGIGLDDETSARGAGIFTGIWFVVSALISIFVGSYFAARISKFRTGRIGSAQGLVIAALFVGFFLYQTMATIGMAGQAMGGMIKGSGGMIAQGVDKATESPVINNAVSSVAEDAIGDLNLKSDIRTVGTAVASRLVRGDSEGAKNYLSMQAGITPAEADTRIAQMKTRVDKIIEDAREGTAAALKSIGWSLFLLTLLGSLAAVAGGAMGSVANFRKPLIRQEGIGLGRQASV